MYATSAGCNRLFSNLPPAGGDGKFFNKWYILVNHGLSGAVVRIAASAIFKVLFG